MTTKAAPQGFVVGDWKAFERGAMCGWFSLLLPSRMILRDVSLHEEPDGRRWVGMPSKRFDKADGSTGYTNLIDFETREVRNAFQKHALAAIDKYFEAHPEQATGSTTAPNRKTAATGSQRKQAAAEEIGFDDLEPLNL